MKSFVVFCPISPNFAFMFLKKVLGVYMRQLSINSQRVYQCCRVRGTWGRRRIGRRHPRYLKMQLCAYKTEKYAEGLDHGKSSWRSGHQSRLPPLLKMLYVDWVSVDLNLTSRVSSGHSGFLPPQNLLLVYSNSNGCRTSLKTTFEWVELPG